MNNNKSTVLKVYGSEEYAAFLEQEELEWHNNYDELIIRKLELYDRLISMHQKETYDMISQLIDDESTLVIQKRNNDYAYMVIFNQIYESEKEAGEQIFLYDYGDSLKELIAVTQQIKFYLWELEFLKEDETRILLKHFVNEFKISKTLLRNMILISCIERQEMAALLSELLDMDIVL